MFSKAYYIPNQMCLENISKDAVYLMLILKTQGAIGQSDRLSSYFTALSAIMHLQHYALTCFLATQLH